MAGEQWLCLLVLAFVQLRGGNVFGFLPIASQISGKLFPPESLLVHNDVIFAVKSSFHDEFGIYSRDLKEKVKQESLEYQIVDRDKWWKVSRLNFSFGRNRKQPGKLILLKNGESTWSINGTYVGWADPDLSTKGIRQCEHAASLLIAEGYEPDLVYTSRLKRSVNSARIVLEQMQSLFLPMYKSWRLNERSYGALTGLSKKETAKKFGTTVVQAWRNSLKARPPLQSRDDPYFPGNNPCYADLTENEIPQSESVLDCMKRTRALWDYKIRKDLARGDNVLVVCHRNSLLGLIQAIDDIEDKHITKVSIPSGIPLVYRFDSKMKPLPPQKNKASPIHTSGTYLEKPGLLEEALKTDKAWEATVPGLEKIHVEAQVRRHENLEETLSILKREKVEPEVLLSFCEQDPWEDDESGFEESQFFSEQAMERQNKVMVTVEPLPAANTQPDQTDPVVVFIRHGRTPHNNLALFTGWEDPPLAEEGVEDARKAGRILKRHGYQFDVVYTSWLTRAIQTALTVLEEMDCLWVPLVKSWRLNERMYGALTGKSKAMVANTYGEEQLKKWRRGFKIRPPPVSSYSPQYPGNDYKRTKYVRDLRISWSETICRSIANREFEIHRKFPKTESLHDCMRRSIPFYTDRIVSEAVSKGKRVLITGHENSIRGILMHLCNIPEEAMNQLHIPNGMPLVYSLEGKCIKLLDDGTGRDPMNIHDFGPAAQYLFKPCDLDENFFEEMALKRVSAPIQAVGTKAEDAAESVNGVPVAESLES